MKTYTYDETLAKLKEIVELKGEDFVYYGDPKDEDFSACFYAQDGKPDCGVGHVLAAFGVGISDLETYGEYASGFALTVLNDLRRDNVMAFDLRARLLLGTFQRHQDAHISWGESLKRAIERVKELRD